MSPRAPWAYSFAIGGGWGLACPACYAALPPDRMPLDYGQLAQDDCSPLVMAPPFTEPAKHLTCEGCGCELTPPNPWTPRDGERVIVNTGGDDAPGVVSRVRPWNDALRGSVLVRFDGNPPGSAQWIPTKYLRRVSE